ncbi:hypothetical protein FB446DRAFT_824091 [Lentinula raphanica]|nr:hypothetical protein FB446DRAFT_824091 [Lentinula raphanica]
MFLTSSLLRHIQGQHSSDDRFSAQKALQTVAAGQQAENLRDFDDTPVIEGRPSGLAATEVLSHTPAAPNLFAGTSSNPLDDLVLIFGVPAATAPATPASAAPRSAAPSAAAGPHDVFGGLGGLGMGVSSTSSANGTGSLGSPAVSSPSVVVPPSQQPQDDLLGLF